MSILIDLIVLAIIILVIYFSSRRGFVRVFIELVGFVAAILISFTISTPLANTTYDKIIEPPLLSSVKEHTDNSTNEAVDVSWEKLPPIIKNNAEKFGISREKFNENIIGNVNNGIEGAVKQASQNAVKPVATKFISLLYSLIISIILIFVSKILARLLNKLFSFSIVGKLNRFLGGIIGIPKGIIISIVFCLLVSFIVSLTGNGFFIFTKDSIDNTVLFKFLCNLTPFKL